ncbi:MAG TPA: KamA family radical SAM protein [Rhabdochlamydiaceae bacterium]|nr:KamA family radical SAM protein [Rhabdochlamydiaceae bacterium]
MASITWRMIQKENFTHWEKLADFLLLDDAQRNQILKNPKFPLNLPKRLAEKIAKRTFNDPILKQFLPVDLEHVESVGFVKEPLQDFAFKKEKKLLHKYQGRAMLLCTSACAMNCRFCFRQNFEYDREDKLFDEELILIEKDTTLEEIILSGGDPLSLSNKILEDLFTRLSAIPHLKRLRIHTRFPIGIPERIDSKFLTILQSCPLQIYVVIHCNHAMELDPEILSKLKTIQKLGIPILSQTVLLKDVNDEANTLKELFNLLVDHGIQPYYLHQLDRVQGTAHFEVHEEKGLSLMKQLSAQLSGYAVPRYVKEVPYEPSKVPL